LSSVNNAYTLTLVVPGTSKAVSLSPGAGGGCDSLEACKTATGYNSPTITYRNSIYALREILFHTPSEHTIDGVPAAGEVQLVSELVDCVKCTCPGWGSAGYGGQQWCCCVPNNNDKKVLIQSVLLARGRPSSAPAWFSAVASVAKTVTGEPLALLPDLFFRDVSMSIHATMSTYFFYDGSLSAPPCSPQVQWLVVKKPLDVGSDDLAAIAALSIGGNARAVQPLNGRVLSVAGTVQL
jgi:carbonic anhydrase